MPTRPQRLCLHPGCVELTDSSRCEKHRRQDDRERDRARPNSADRGYDGRWRKFRALYLASHPICESDEGCARKATDPHHIQRLIDGGAKYDESNLQALCGEHHDGLGGAGGRA